MQRRKEEKDMRNTKPVWKTSRRLGFSILETGEELKRRSYGPGQHGNDRKKKPSEYGKQLIEKQKLRHMYGVNEKQFRRLFRLAQKSKGVTGLTFMHILESRLDNVCYRLGFARTRRGARQLVNHNHVLVNGKRANIPSMLLKVNDIVSIKPGHELKVVKEALEVNKNPVAWVEVDADKLQGKLIRMPERNELPRDISEAQIVEYYNRLL